MSKKKEYVIDGVAYNEGQIYYDDNDKRFMIVRASRW